MHRLVGSSYWGWRERGGVGLLSCYGTAPHGSAPHGLLPIHPPKRKGRGPTGSRPGWYVVVATREPSPASARPKPGEAR